MFKEILLCVVLNVIQNHAGQSHPYITFILKFVLFSITRKYILWTFSSVLRWKLSRHKSRKGYLYLEGVQLKVDGYVSLR